MKFKCSTTINLPLERTVELFNKKEHCYKWQDGLQRIELIDGIEGQEGAKSKMHFKNKKYEFDLIETILVNNLPEEMTGLYEHKHMDNTMTNSFTAIDSHTTRYDVFIEYIKFKSFMPKLMAFLMPGMFKKQTQKWLDQFKLFAESQGRKSGE
jgi:hypothetical protein